MIFFGLEQFYYEVGLSCLDFVEVLKYFNVSMKFGEIFTVIISCILTVPFFYLFFILLILYFIPFYFSGDSSLYLCWYAW